MSANVILSVSLIQTFEDSSLTYSKYAMSSSLQGITLAIKQRVVSESISTAIKFFKFFEICNEWPVVATLAMKLISREPLTNIEEQNLKELALATGLNMEDIKNELINLAADPSERIRDYKELLERYYKEALELFDSGNTRQAGEKIWASVLSLIKLYASLKRIFIAYWSRGKIDNFIASNVEPKYKKFFRELVDRAQILHEHFYEGHLNEELFKERWNEVVELFEKTRRMIYEEFQL